MKIQFKCRSKGLIRALRRGFTLIEMTVVLVLAAVVAFASTMMLNQQVNFYRWLTAQNFILQEAPVANNLVVRILSQADAFRIHNNRADALSDTNGLTTGGTSLVIGFAKPDGTRQFGLIEFNIVPGDATGVLTYTSLVRPPIVTPTVLPDLVVDSEWIITTGAANVTFGIDANGVLVMDMTGPKGGNIQYAASSSL